MLGVALAFLAGLLSLAAGQGEKVEVHSCTELREALANAAVRHVLLMPRAGGDIWNCSAADFPPFSVEISGRDVVMEGYGDTQLYYDANKVNNQIIVHEGASLTVANLWADNCVQGDTVPFTCLATTKGGWLTFRDSQISDASCLHIKRSHPVNSAALAFNYTMAQTQGRFDHEYVDYRTLLLRATDYLQNIPEGHNWRAVNVNFTCTGNVTFPLPPGFEEEGMSPLQYRLTVAGSVALTLMACALGWFAYKRWLSTGLAEYGVALSQGFVLEAPLGSGHFGRVYRARSRTAGQLVAVKVIDLLPSQRRQVAAAWRECQLMKDIQHESIVHVLTFYTAHVQQKQRIVELEPGGNQYVELGYNVAAVLEGDQAPLPNMGTADRRTGGASPTVRPGSSAGAGSGSGSGGAQLNTSSGSASVMASGSGLTSSSTSEGMEGIVCIQVHLVMQYCDMGTLEQAVRRGDFHDAESGRPKLRHIALTALEIARGLEYLHHPARRMVHRDLSAANVLLATATGDERGFRALLSDFGLSTSLAAGATHRTSEVKGTLSYMSPELFLNDDVSPALDVYSFGIILHIMCTGRDPYQDMAAPMIILAKVRASSQPGAARLPRIEGVPTELQQLVWDCTAHNRRERPTASHAAERLQALLSTL